MLPLKPSYTLATALLALLAAQPAFALDNDQIASVFGAGATDLTGNSIQLPQFMFTVVTNTSESSPPPAASSRCEAAGHR